MACIERANVFPPDFANPPNAPAVWRKNFESLGSGHNLVFPGFFSFFFFHPPPIGVPTSKIKVTIKMKEGSTSCPQSPSFHAENNRPFSFFRHPFGDCCFCRTFWFSPPCPLLLFFFLRSFLVKVDIRGNKWGCFLFLTQNFFYHKPLNILTLWGGRWRRMIPCQFCCFGLVHFVCSVEREVRREVVPAFGCFLNACCVFFFERVLLGSLHDKGSGPCPRTQR